MCIVCFIPRFLHIIKKIVKIDLMHIFELKVLLHHIILDVQEGHEDDSSSSAVHKDNFFKFLEKI